MLMGNKKGKNEGEFCDFQLLFNDAEKGKGLQPTDSDEYNPSTSRDPQRGPRGWLALHLQNQSKTLPNTLKVG